MEAKARHAKIFQEQIKKELKQAVAKRAQDAIIPENKGYFETVYDYTSPSSWVNWWTGGNKEVPAPIPVPDFEAPDEIPSTVEESEIDPRSVITNPLILDVYFQMEAVIANHAKFLGENLGSIVTCEITMKNGKVQAFTTDLRAGQGKIFVGKSDVAANLTMKMSEDTFVKLFSNKLSPATALMWGQLSVSSTSEAQKFGSVFFPLMKKQKLMILLI
jgi:putative sterol carrier protein